MRGSRGHDEPGSGVGVLGRREISSTARARRPGGVTPTNESGNWDEQASLSNKRTAPLRIPPGLPSHFLLQPLTLTMERRVMNAASCPMMGSRAFSGSTWMSILTGGGGKWGGSLQSDTIGGRDHSSVHAPASPAEAGHRRPTTGRSES